MQQLTRRSVPVQQAGTQESLSGNIRSALARNLPEFQPAIAFNDGHFVIVGSGPSLPAFLEELREERAKGRPICAVKGAHDWMVENGLEPDFFISCEPRERPLKRINDRTTYLIASRCNPDLFDQLTGKQVVIWHSAASKGGIQPEDGRTSLEWDDLDLLDECEAWRGRFAIGGGSTSGLRALYVGFLLGFRKFILYGFDSCLDKDRDTKRFTGEKVGAAWIGDVIADGRRFWCNGALMQQAIEFQEVYRLPNISIEAKGDGLIAAILKGRAATGLPV